MGLYLLIVDVTCVKSLRSSYGVVSPEGTPSIIFMDDNFAGAPATLHPNSQASPLNLNPHPSTLSKGYLAHKKLPPPRTLQ